MAGDYPRSHAHVAHHLHHNRRHDDDDDNFQPPPPPSFHGGEYNDSSYPPPPPSYGGGGGYDPSYQQPPPSYGGGGYDPSYQQQPPPSYGGAYDNAPPPEHEEGHHRFQPHVPGFIGTHFHHGSSNEEHGSSTHSSIGPGPGLDGPELAHLIENKPSHKILCKAGGDRYCFGIRDDHVVLTHPDVSDLTQHWFKDERYSTRVKDKDGYPSFILVNKGTGLVIKHSVSCHPVQLAPYHPDVFDESVLWTEGKDRGSGFRTIRTVNNVGLVMDAWNADKDHGGLHDGTLIALYEAWKGDNENQQWKIVRLWD